jgi:hypothetical protein
MALEKSGVCVKESPSQSRKAAKKFKKWFYSGCQKNVPIAGRFFVTTLMPPSYFRNIIMTNGIKF